MLNIDETTRQALEKEVEKKQEEASLYGESFGYEVINFMGQAGQAALDISSTALQGTCDAGMVVLEGSCEVAGAVLSGVAEVLGGLG